MTKKKENVNNKKSMKKSNDDIDNKIELIRDFILKKNITQFDLIDVVEDLFLTSYYSIIETAEGEALADKKVDLIYDLAVDVAAAIYETAIDRIPKINEYELIVTSVIATGLITRTITENKEYIK
ncbi:MAG: hypothetical protein JG776_2280 [Caloramator sp.]|jgi:hypothetical protein|uniref:hypothetical protein n=1 Tax=Caloramator sp. TaxID=1871330 RepID=UPI001DAE89C6|nr:hypothetical protein [Caloramator sp.]MBZ4664556.1 hypothetical protein [Caloramator sp.]